MYHLDMLIICLCVAIINILRMCGYVYAYGILKKNVKNLLFLTHMEYFGNFCQTFMIVTLSHINIFIYDFNCYAKYFVNISFYREC